MSAVTSTACKYLYLESTGKLVGGEGAGDGSLPRSSGEERQSLAITCAALWVLGGGLEPVATGGRVKVRFACV